MDRSCQNVQPAFFFVSGMLVYASYKNCQSSSSYAANRFYRLFPGLVFVTVGALCVVLYVKGIEDLLDKSGFYAKWILSQITVGQAYSPAYFRDIGVGVLNGSLWTITVEIFFYFMVPVIHWLDGRSKLALPLLFIASYSLYCSNDFLFSGVLIAGKGLNLYLGLTPLPWGWMFLTGILFIKYADKISPYINLFKFSAVPMLVLIYVDWDGALFNTTDNNLGLLYFILYSLLILYFTFGTKLKLHIKGDISYGVYIWHMPVINLCLIVSLTDLWIAVILTILLSIFSWVLVERPALKLKSRSLKPV